MNAITSVIEKTRDQFILDKKLEDAQDINCGWCDCFATEILFQLQDYKFYEMDSYQIMILEDEESEYGLLIQENLKRHFNLEVPEHFEGVKIGYHVWVTDGTEHYDAECPAGVPNMLDLPFFQRYRKRNE